MLHPTPAWEKPAALLGGLALWVLLAASTRARRASAASSPLLHGLGVLCAAKACRAVLASLRLGDALEVPAVLALAPLAAAAVGLALRARWSGRACLLAGFAVALGEGCTVAAVHRAGAPWVWQGSAAVALESTTVALLGWLLARRFEGPSR